MNMINRSNLRIELFLILLLSMAGLLLVGCQPTIIARVGDTPVRCDGTFVAEVKVSQYDTRRTQDINITLGDIVNINPEVAVNPTKFKLSDDQTKQVFVSGTLTNPCNPGSLNFTATGAPVFVSGSTLINIKAAPMIGTAPNGVTPNVRGKFTYDVTLNCCPGATGAYQITLSGTNMTNLAANPSTVNCPRDETQTVTISGKLSNLEQEGKVFLLITGPAGGTCTLLTNVEQAR